MKKSGGIFKKFQTRATETLVERKSSQSRKVRETNDTIDEQDDEEDDKNSLVYIESQRNL